MAILVKELVSPTFVNTSATSQYIASNTRAIIDKVTFTNVGAVNVGITVNLVSANSFIGSSNIIVFVRNIAPQECYVCTEIIGHVLNPGSSIFCAASTPNVVVLRISGREIT